MNDVIEQAIKIVVNRHDKAIKKYKPFNSAKEGWAVIQFELDELKELIQLNKASFDGQRPIPIQEKMIEEAAQVSAMALRFMVDLCEGSLKSSSLKETEKRRVT